jgi:hypothetical protein
MTFEKVSLFHESHVMTLKKEPLPQELGKALGEDFFCF